MAEENEFDDLVTRWTEGAEDDDSGQFDDVDDFAARSALEEFSDSHKDFEEKTRTLLRLLAGLVGAKDKAELDQKNLHDAVTLAYNALLDNDIRKAKRLLKKFV